MFLLRSGGLICLIFPLFSSQEFVFKTIQDVSNQECMQMTKVTFEILHKVVCDTSGTINIVKAFENNRNGINLIDELLKKNSLDKEFNFGSQLSSQMSAIKTIKSRKKTINVIYLDTIESFHILNHKIVSKVFSFRGFYIFVIVGEKFVQFKEIFEAFWIKNIFNVDVIVQNGSDIDVWTFLPFDGVKCGDTTPKLVEKIHRGKSFDIDSIFPHKFKNLMNCPVLIATFDDNLSVIRTQKPDGSIQFSGFDIEIMNEIAKLINFNQVFKFIEGPHPFGLIYSNGTVDGALGELVNGVAKIAMGRYFLGPNRTEVAENSLVYFNFPEVIVISPGRKLSAFEKLFQPFDTFSWILLMITFATALIVIFVVKIKLPHYQVIIFGSGNQDPVTNLFVAFIGGNQTRIPKQNFSRCLLMMWLIFCLIIRNSYQGSMYNFLQSDESLNQGNTIEDLVERNFDLYMYPWVFSIFESQPHVLARYQKSIQINAAN